MFCRKKRWSDKNSHSLLVHDDDVRWWRWWRCACRPFSHGAAMLMPNTHANRSSAHRTQCAVCLPRWVIINIRIGTPLRTISMHRHTHTHTECYSVYAVSLCVSDCNDQRHNVMHRAAHQPRMMLLLLLLVLLLGSRDSLNCVLARYFRVPLKVFRNAQHRKGTAMTSLARWRL